MSHDEPDTPPEVTGEPAPPPEIPADHPALHPVESDPLEPVEPRQLMVLTVAVEGGMLAIAVALGWWLDISFWTKAGATWPLVGWAIIWTVPLAAGFIVLVETSWRATAQVRDDLARFTKHISRCGVPHLALMSVLAGIGEEALFRGALLPWLAGPLGTAGALLVTSVLFGMAHAISKAYVVGTTIIGLFLGALYLWHDSLFVVMAIHALYDFIALTYAVKLRPQALAQNDNTSP